MRILTRRSWALSIVAVVGLLIVIAAAFWPAAPETGIVAGPNEQTFTERYAPAMTLPLAETEFVRTLDELGLKYEVRGEPGSGEAIEPPRRSTTLDMSTIQKSYRIYGATDTTRHVAERYRAFVDRDGRVVYVENNFQYTGP